MDLPNDLVTVDEIAAEVGRHRQSVYRALNELRWPGYRQGRRWLVSRSEIMALLAPRPYGSASDAH